MRRAALVGVVIVAIGGISLLALLLLRKGGPGGPQCPLTFPEFTVTPKEKVVNVRGRATLPNPNGAPFARGPIEINLTFMMPGCGALPFTTATDGDGRFTADSPAKEPDICIAQGGTATARTKAGCDIEGTAQGSW